ncbi:hypothetical protein H0R94_06805 [Treponema socranskii]|uniref:hypothetical protein n=1 Tax=Treponema socranskii TaxID=53419 RepID=UPI003D8BA325
MHSNGIPGYEHATQEEQQKAMHRIFRETFSTESGRLVFNWLLTDLHYFEPVKNEAEQALNNYAKALLYDRMGIIDSIALTDAMINQIQE